MTERVKAPCVPSGEVRSIWLTNIDGGAPGLYAVEDNDSKEAECRCPFGACCVDTGNYVIQGVVLSVGGVENLTK
jgi:hypothetical protein